MSANHNHPTECEHKMKHCAKCDKAYCSACGKEWPQFIFNDDCYSKKTVPYKNPFPDWPPHPYIYCSNKHG